MQSVTGRHMVVWHMTVQGECAEGLCADLFISSSPSNGGRPFFTSQLGMPFMTYLQKWFLEGQLILIKLGWHSKHQYNHLVYQKFYSKFCKQSGVSYGTYGGERLAVGMAG